MCVARHTAPRHLRAPPLSAAQDGKSALRARFGGWLRDVDRFDASLFALTPNEVELMDPQQRLLLEVSWEAIQSAHQRLVLRQDARAPATGVYVGIQQMEYGSLATAHVPVMGAFSGESSFAALMFPLPSAHSWFSPCACSHRHAIQRGSRPPVLHLWLLWPCGQHRHSMLLRWACPQAVGTVNARSASQRPHVSPWCAVLRCSHGGHPHGGAAPAAVPRRRAVLRRQPHAG